MGLSPRAGGTVAVRLAGLLATAPLVASCVAVDAPAGTPATSRAQSSSPESSQPSEAPAGSLSEPSSSDNPATVPASPDSTPAQAATAGEWMRVRLRRAVRDLDVRRETRSGYDRDAFRHWVDADGDCQDTRDEVLAAEALTKVSGCDIQEGRWRSVYDGRVVAESSELDVDHMVALAEAWDSGARRWTAGTRERFANDLDDRRSLVAVTSSSNRSKSDNDPAEWLPDRRRCGYVTSWVAVKTRWSLAVDRAERRALVSLAQGCGNSTIEVRAAALGRPAPTSSGGTDQRHRSCSDALAAGHGPYVRGEDAEYAWYVDGDDDGVVCES
jgi:hypothetical protein